jgi:hypothetical protein
MKITICGSIAFIEEMVKLKLDLEKMGHEVKTPAVSIKDESGKEIPILEYYKKRQIASNDDKWMWNKKNELMMDHFRRIDWCDAILVANYEKNGVKGYIGGNTLMELGVALWLGKKIYLLMPIPEIGYKEEILAVKPTVINNDLTFIK